jgi:hypothetical protein
MKIALVRASYLALSLLLLTVPSAFIGFKWPLQHEPIMWGPLLLSLASAAGLSGVGFVGAAIGFGFLPSRRMLSRRSLFALGMLFTISAFLGFGPVFEAVGMTGAVVSLALLALGVASVGGYVASRNAV